MWTRLLRPIDDAHGVPDSVLTLTAIVLLLRPLDVWWVAPIIIAAACLSLLSRAVRHAPITWMLIALLIATRIVVVWPLSDNHIYLLAYWCLAIGLALTSATPAATLSTGSRLLLGGAFAMAILWKAVLSPDYVDGRFFRVTLLTDERFADASLVFGGLSREQMKQNREFLKPLPEGAELLTPPSFVEPPRLRASRYRRDLGRADPRRADRCRVPDSAADPAGPRASRVAAHVLLHHLCARAGRRVRVAAGDDGAGAVPSGSVCAAWRVCRGVHPDPDVFGDSVDRDPRGLGGAVS